MLKRLLAVSTAMFLTLATFAFAAELRGIDPNTFPVLTRNLPLLENNAFLTRWESGRDRPMDRSFDVALDVLVRGLRSKII